MGLMDKLFGKSVEAPKPMSEVEKMKARSAQLQQERASGAVAKGVVKEFQTAPVPEPGADPNVPIIKVSKAPQSADALVKGPLSGRVQHSVTPISEKGLADLNTGFNPRTLEGDGINPRGLDMSTQPDRITELDRGQGLKLTRAGINDLAQQVPVAEESWSARKAREEREARESKEVAEV